MFQLDFDPAPTEVRIFRCGYIAQCKARGCPRRATLIYRLFVRRAAPC
jgi:hypothetical protein